MLDIHSKKDQRSNQENSLRKLETKGKEMVSRRDRRLMLEFQKEVLGGEGKVCGDY